jgi:RNA polymerase sigma-70 factor (ECF subfamily)
LKQVDSPSGGPSDARARFEATALPVLAAVHATARRLTRGGDHARDLVQETYLRAYRTFGNFIPESNARAWLLTILYSVFINQYRRDQRTPALVELADAERTAPMMLSDGRTTAEEIERDIDRWSSAEIERALDALPDAFREAVLLVDVEDLTYEETATVLSVPVGTVRSRLFRGRKLLHTALFDFARRTGHVRPAPQVSHE